MKKGTEKEKMEQRLGNHKYLDQIWAVIPVYNNKDTVKDVALGCLGYLEHVLVIDDGSTDADVTQIFKGSNIMVLRHAKNLGKGKAIQTALDYIRTKGARFMITVDADGQHYPEDLGKFIPLLGEDESFILVGSRNFESQHIPDKSRFGRKLANFWLTIETGISLNDCQSGFRAYPVKYISKLKLDGAHYDFETEILTRASWSGLTLKSIPIEVWYPIAGSRVSHFRPLLDNLRISLMHARLVGRRILPMPYRRLILGSKTDAIKYNLRNPIKLIRVLLSENATPAGLAVSASLGVFLAALPLVSAHILVIIYVTTRLHLNKVMALAVQNLCIPPFVPILCIELGHFMIYGKWLTDISLNTIFGQIGARFWEWFLGSLLLAPILAVIIGLVVFLVSRKLQKIMCKYAAS